VSASRSKVNLIQNGDFQFAGFIVNERRHLAFSRLREIRKPLVGGVEA
jgi:hypothetical protein